MISLDSQFERRLPLTHRLVRALAKLHEFRGKEELYRQQIPETLESLKLAAVIQSTESSNRIEGVVAPLDRIRSLIEEKTTPQDRPEQEIAGYRDVLNLIHTNHPAMRLTSGLVLQLHRELFKYTGDEGGIWKNTANRITRFRDDGTQEVRFEPPPPHLVAGLMESLHESLNQFRDRDEVDPLLLIATYVLDFLCIHPFRDGNGRMARLLTLLLLYQSGYEVGRFISLERIVETSKESYYDTLYASSQRWHSGEHTLQPWIEYFLGTVTAAYGEFEERVDVLTSSRGAKTDMVRTAIDNFVGDFSVQDLMGRCPTVSIDWIRRILQEHKDLGIVECLGKGRGARWRKLRSRNEIAQ